MDDITFEISSGTAVNLTQMERIARARLRDPEHAKEAVYRVVVKLLSLPPEKCPDDPDRYAAVAICNAARTLQRREAKQRNTQVDIPLDSLELASDGPERKAISAQFLKNFHKQLKGRRLRQVVVLLYEGLNQTQIAERLGYSRETIRKDLIKIKKLIEELNPPDPPFPTGGGGGRKAKKRGGAAQPPARADPLLSRRGVRSRSEAVATNKNEVQLGKEINYGSGEHDDMRHALQSRSQGLRGARRQSAAAEVAGELKRLLLQLPAFREAGLAPCPDPEVQDLEGVLSRVLCGRKDEPL